MKSINEIMMGFGHGTPTVEQMYSIEKNEWFSKRDEVVDFFEKTVNSMNESGSCRINMERFFTAGVSNLAKADGNEWYTIPRENSETEYWFLVVLGKNGGTKSFAKEVLEPLSIVLKELESIGCIFPTLVDASMDNADDLYYFVINTAR